MDKYPQCAATDRPGDHATECITGRPTAAYGRLRPERYFVRNISQLVFTQPFTVEDAGDDRVYRIGTDLFHLPATRRLYDRDRHGPEFKRLRESLRVLTPIEFERLQGLPDDYTSILTRPAHRYHAIGNGFTIPVIAHILSHAI